jgi:transketolase
MKNIVTVIIDGDENKNQSKSGGLETLRQYPFKKKPINTMNRHESQRGYFSFELWLLMQSNINIYLVTGDLGYGQFDQIKKDFPNRFINVGAAEQSMIGVGVGLALEGKIPICYSITPFAIYRPFEWIRNYLDHEKISVIIVGGGRSKDYKDDGFTHWAEEDKEVMKLFKNVDSYWPETKEEIPELLGKIIESKKATYLNLTR